MAPGHRSYSLTKTDLEALADGEYTVEIIERLREAEVSRNSLLAEAFRRTARNIVPIADYLLIESATKILSAVHEHSPDVVEQVLTLPHFGFWAADCLIRLRHSEIHPHSISALTKEDISHIAAFAAVAALTANHYFELPLPVRSGNVYLPSLGSVNVGDTEENGWAQIIFDSSGIEILSSGTRHGVFNVLVTEKTTTPGSLKPTARLHVQIQGLSLDVLLDDSDPFLSRLGPVSTPLTDDSIHEWQSCIEQAWATLVSHHRTTAQALARVVTTLVPLFEPRIDHPISAASGWAWGAVALSLPPDPFSLAETLVHEFRHLILSAVEDIATLIEGDDDGLFYSPWRNDPRSISSLLQASYAFSGVIAFWQEYRHAKSRALRRRAELAFALGRFNVLEAINLLRDSNSLTSTGLFFIERMERQVNNWMKHPVATSTEAVASEIATEHRLRWRLANVMPEKRLVRAVADAWMANLEISVDQITCKILAASSATPTLRERSRFLEHQFVNLDSTVHEMSEVAGVNSGDDALLRGEAARARDEYLREVSESGDLDAWIGLMLALRRLGALDECWSTQHPIEIIVAVYDYIRSTLGRVPDIEALVLWIIRVLGPT